MGHYGKIMLHKYFLSRKNSCWFFFFIMISEKKGTSWTRNFLWPEMSNTSLFKRLLYRKVWASFLLKTENVSMANINFMPIFNLCYDRFLLFLNSKLLLCMLHINLSILWNFFSSRMVFNALKSNFLILYHASNHDEVQ